MAYTSFCAVIFKHSFIHSFIHSFTHSLIHSFILICHSLIHSFIHSLIHSFLFATHSFIHSFIHLLTHIHSFSFAHSHSFIHSIIHIYSCMLTPNTIATCSCRSPTHSRGCFTTGGLLLIDKSSLCGGSGFPFSLSEWSLTICLMPYNRRSIVLSASLNKTFLSVYYRWRRRRPRGRSPLPTWPTPPSTSCT